MIFCTPLEPVNLFASNTTNSSPLTAETRCLGYKKKECWKLAYAATQLSDSYFNQSGPFSRVTCRCDGALSKKQYTWLIHTDRWTHTHTHTHTHIQTHPWRLAAKVVVPCQLKQSTGYMTELNWCQWNITQSSTTYRLAARLAGQQLAVCPCSK